MNTYSYKTVFSEGTSLFKDRGSKFYGFTFRVHNEDEVKAALDNLKSKYHDARHHCYAYRLFTSPIRERANDDGEPGNSAGTPILNQIYSAELYNTLVVVVRYFGGTKLGVPGLINAYKSAAKEAMANSVIKTVDLTKIITIETDYAHLNDAMRLIKQHDLKIIEQLSTDKVKLVVSIKQSIFEFVMHQFELNIHLTTKGKG